MALSALTFLSAFFFTNISSPGETCNMVLLENRMLLSLESHTIVALFCVPSNDFRQRKNVATKVDVVIQTVSQNQNQWAKLEGCYATF